MSENKTAEETVKNNEHDTNPPIILNKQQWQCVYNWMQEYSNQQNQELQRQVLKLTASRDAWASMHNDVLESLRESSEDNVKLQSQYTQLKEAADEMADELMSAINLNNSAREHISDDFFIRCKSKLTNYKQLTQKQ